MVEDVEENGQITVESQEKTEEAFNLFSNFLEETTKDTVQAIANKDKMENVAIFVDYDNVYWTLENNYRHNPDSFDDRKNLFVQLWHRYKQDNVRTFRAYADFQKIRTSLTSLQKKRIQIRHVYSNEKNGDYRKNSSDIELCIDAIENTYKDPSISCYVFVTADSDMIPILSRMMYKGKRVELFYLSDALPKHVDMTTYAHFSQDLLEFINVEVKEINIENYIEKSVSIIHEWHNKFQNSNHYLGAPWLKQHMSDKLEIPPNDCSTLLEKLNIEGYIRYQAKKMENGDSKSSIVLTDKGLELIKNEKSYSF